MKTYRVYQIDAFTDKRFEGNPAGVIANADGLTDAQMQTVSRELNNSETAFILKSAAPDHDVRVRFFTPTMEVPTCGHATISAHYVRALELDLPSGSVLQKIGIGILPVDIIRKDSDYRIVMTQGEPDISPTITGETNRRVLDAIGLADEDLDARCPMQVASTGSSKVMVGIKKREKLNSLRPNLNQLASLSRTIGSKGYFVFTFDSDNDDILTHGRMFAPAMGIPEDPVTGNANGPLGAYLVHHRLLDAPDGRVEFKGKQGEAMGRPGVVTVIVHVENGKATRVQVSGRAAVAFKTEIEL